jgi:glycine/D-amino acid oxidase-like deaminating enzyme
VHETDVLIVGAGVTGVSAGLELLRRGRKALIVERREVGAGASGNNAGSCAVQNKPAPLVPLARDAVEVWRELHEELLREGLDLDYTRKGGFRLAESPEEVEALGRSAEHQRSVGVAIEHLTGDEARRRAPYLGPAIAAANWCANDGYCDVLHAMKAIAAAFTRRGGEIWTHTEAEGADPKGDGFVVRTTRGPVRARNVFLAGGTWMRDLAGPVAPPAQVKVRINVLTVTPRVAPVFPHMITHISHKLTMKQLPVGTIMVGGGWQGGGDYRTYKGEPSFDSLVGNWRMAVRAIPALERLPVLRTWAGFDGRMPDEQPVVGELPQAPGAYIAGYASGGWTLGPLLARCVVEMMSGRGTPDIVAPFSPRRFAQTPASA